jgi:hypothetical protein
MELVKLVISTKSTHEITTFKVAKNNNKNMYCHNNQLESHGSDPSANKLEYNGWYTYSWIGARFKHYH